MFNHALSLALMHTPSHALTHALYICMLCQDQVLAQVCATLAEASFPQVQCTIVPALHCECTRKKIYHALESSINTQDTVSRHNVYHGYTHQAMHSTQLASLALHSACKPCAVLRLQVIVY